MLRADYYKIVEPIQKTTTAFKIQIPPQTNIYLFSNISFNWDYCQARFNSIEMAFENIM